MGSNSLPEGLDLKTLKPKTPPDVKRTCGGTCSVATCCRITGKACCSAVPTLMTGSPELVEKTQRPQAEESQEAAPQTPEA